MVFWHMHLLQQTCTNNLGTLQHTQCQKIFADTENRFRCPTYIQLPYTSLGWNDLVGCPVLMGGTGPLGPTLNPAL